MVTYLSEFLEADGRSKTRKMKLAVKEVFVITRGNIAKVLYIVSEVSITQKVNAE